MDDPGFEMYKVVSLLGFIPRSLRFRYLHIFHKHLAASTSRSWNEEYELEAMKLFKCVLTIGDSSAILSILQIPRVRREGQNAREVFFYRIFPD